MTACCPHCGARLLPAISAADEAILAALWPIVAAEAGTEPWTLSELRQRPNVRLVVGSRSPASLGQLFAKAAGQIIAGYELEQAARHGSRTLWRLWRRVQVAPAQEGSHESAPRPSSQP